MKNPERSVEIKPQKSTFYLRSCTVALPEQCPVELINGLKTHFRQHGLDDVTFKHGHDVNDSEENDVLAIGHFDSNPLIGRLYRKRMSFADRRYPGHYGYSITSLLHPLNQSSNVILISASHDRELSEAVKAFLSLLPEKSAKLPYIHKVRLKSHRLTGFEKAFRAVNLKDCISTLEKGDNKKAAHLATEQALYSYLTGKGNGITIFRDYFLYYLAKQAEAGNYAGNMVYSWLWKVFITWELIQADPAFSQTQQQTISEGLYRIMEFQCELFRSNVERPTGEIRHNHWTYLGISAFMGLNFFKRHHEISGWQDIAEKIDNLFEGQSASCKIDDDASGYSWQVPRHFLLWHNYQERLDYFENGHLRRLADSAITITDNMGAVATFGDHGAYSGPGFEPQPFILGPAHWFYRLPEFRWLLNMQEKYEQQSKPGSISRLLEAMGYFNGCFYTDDNRSQYPRLYTGIHPLLLDEPAVNWVRARFDHEEKNRFPADRDYFDKISFRNEFDKNSEYLMLEGTSTFSHGHQDGNAIVRLTWNNRVWLCDMDYLRGMPEQSNSLTIVRNGQSGNVPPLTLLSHQRDFAATGYTHTVSQDYNRTGRFSPTLPMPWAVKHRGDLTHTPRTR